LQPISLQLDLVWYRIQLQAIGIPDYGGIVEVFYFFPKAVYWHLGSCFCDEKKLRNGLKMVSWNQCAWQIKFKRYRVCRKIPKIQCFYRSNM
jgi:hypothetical protein